MKRFIDNYLLNWKISKKRKVLLIRGARQVGKTYSVRQLGKAFQFFLEVNFESDKDIHSIFSGNLDPETICMKLSAYYNVPVVDGKTLLFFDEVQACIPAISSLRYFFEKRPGLHLIAAGSLLEFALAQIPSFGVGRIESLYMYPLSFDEFLLANGQETLYRLKQSASPESGFDNIFHKKLLYYLRQFMLLGGMPEVISTFVETGNLIQSQKIIDNLLNGLNDDFAKYRIKVPVSRIRDTLESVVQQSGGKFMLSKVNGNYNHLQIKEAINILEMAGLIQKVTHTAANGLPLGAEANPKKVKLVIFDHGIFHRLLGLEFSKKLLLDDFNFINKGNIAEQFVALEQLKYKAKAQATRLFYWHREKRGSNAEVDFIIVKNGKIIPVEVKSGTTGKMQSLRLFIREKHADYGIRISLENFCTYENIKVYPLYAVHNLLND